MTHSQPLPISCYIRTLNEQRRIGEVVGRARQLCDEVIVVDSGSTDGTLDIARGAGAKVVHQKWLGNGHQKRVGESHARHDWLLDLDADEVLSDELIEEIRHEFAGESPSCDVYRLALTIIDPTGRIWYRAGVAHRAKLYNRRVVEMPAQRAWDQLTIGPQMQVRNLRGALLHHAFADLGHLVRKQEAAMRNRVKGMPRRSRLGVQLRILTGFPWYFLRYFLGRGLWRVGIYGFSFSCVCAFSRWERDVKLYERDWLPQPSRCMQPADSASPTRLPLAG
jgi:glycosyltransferase involved in cell wall biosynthesis